MVLARPRPRRALPAADVVVVDSLYAWTVVGAVRRRRRPLAVAIVHQHPGGSDGSNWARSLRGRLDLATYRRCDLVVTPGSFVANVLVDRHGVEPGRVEVIEPGSDLPPAVPLPPLRAARRLGLLNVANWLPNKGILELLDAVALVPPDDVTLHLAGRDDVAPRYSRRVRRRIERPDLVDRVVVHGAVAAAEVAALHAAADAFAFPSRIETYGSAAGEALAAGLPVVGWRSPHLGALVADDVEGLLVEPGRIDDLAAAIHRLANDEADRRRLADGARRRGARLPTWQHTTDRFFAVLARLMTEPVEPTHHSIAAGDVDAADPGVLDEQATGDRRRHVERPTDRRLDRTDVGHDDHD
jgi:glycosyltransferase involved in cell wall biosynthesis